MKPFFSVIFSILVSVVILSCSGSDVILKQGDSAPDFSLEAQDGKTYSLNDFAGKFVVLYFYPKDNTPGCTAEACNFRDNMSDFASANVQVLGVSTDDVQSHKEFAEEHNLSFPLLADVEGVVNERYGANGFLGMASRKTFVISPTGVISKIYESVDPAEHSQEILRDIQNL